MILDREPERGASEVGADRFVSLPHANTWVDFRGLAHILEDEPCNVKQKLERLSVDAAYAYQGSLHS